MRHERLHRFIRAVWTHYPMKFGAAWLNRRLDRFFDGPEPNWLLAPGRGLWPTMVLNVSINLQRKLFYFPKVYGRFYGRQMFARYLAAELSAGGRFLDIGANVGFYSLMAAQLVGPTGKVWAFEPEPDIHEALVRSARANELAQLEALRIALSDREGELPFYRARDGTASSLVPEVPGREARYERTLVTPVTTLDKLAAAGTIEAKGITLLKVDVEGEEVRTVHGMVDTLAAAGHPPVWCEVRGPKGSTRAPGTYTGVRDALGKLGYVPLRWSDGARTRVDDGDVVERTDVLFERG